MRGSGRGRIFRLVGLLLGLVLWAGCAVPRPEGAEPLRYRDALFSNVTRTDGLSYGSAPDLQGNAVDLKLDLYQPQGDTVSRRPAVIWIHGGGFCCGNRTSGPIVSLANAYARRGYVAVSISYRLLAAAGCGGNPNPTQECLVAAQAAQHDSQAAVRWLRRNATTYRIDPNRIAMGGSSAGAVTTVLGATRSDDPGTSGNPGFSSKIQGAVSIMGGTPTNEYIERGDTTTVFFHGTQDTTVPYAWAQSNAQAMNDRGVGALLYPFQGSGHTLPGQNLPEITEQSSYFLYHVMGLNQAED